MEEGKASCVESQQIADALQAAEAEQPYMDKTKSVKFNSDREERTVALRNVPAGSEKSDLIRLLRPFGKLEKIWMGAVPVSEDSVIVTRANVKCHSIKRLAQSKTCFVLFAEKTSVEHAVAKLNGTVFEGRHLQVSAAGVVERDFKTAVFVSGLGPEVDEEDLREAFARVGRVDHVTIARDKKSKLGLGLALVRFADEVGATAGCGLDGSEFQGRALRVVRAQQKVVKSKASRASEETPEQRRQRIADMIESSEAFAKTKNPERDNYNDAQMENVFRHQPVVPSSRYRKSLKNLKKRGEGDVFKRITKLKTHAVEKLKKEFFEKDNLLKLRREKRKKKKMFNKLNAKNVAKELKKN